MSAANIQSETLHMLLWSRTYLELKAEGSYAFQSSPLPQDVQILSQNMTKPLYVQAETLHMMLLWSSKYLELKLEGFYKFQIPCHLFVSKHDKAPIHTG